MAIRTHGTRHAVRIEGRSDNTGCCAVMFTAYRPPARARVLWVAAFCPMPPPAGHASKPEGRRFKVKTVQQGDCCATGFLTRRPRVRAKHIHKLTRTRTTRTSHVATIVHNTQAGVGPAGPGALPSSPFPPRRAPSVLYTKAALHAFKPAAARAPRDARC